MSIEVAYRRDLSDCDFREWRARSQNSAEQYGGSPVE